MSPESWQTDAAQVDLVRSLAVTCKRLGENTPLWVQGSGGNISVKQSDWLWIKASGARLDSVVFEAATADVAARVVGIARLRLTAFRKDMLAVDMKTASAEQQYSDLIVKHGDAGADFGRPSMESGFHALLKKKWVLHFHSLPALLMARSIAWSRLDFPVIEPMVPGLQLSRKLATLSEAPIILLANHGVILQSDHPVYSDKGEPKGVLADWVEAEKGFCEKWGFASLVNPVRPLPDAPLKLYFPDSAVFRDRLKKAVEDENTRGEDKDALELYEATQMLFQACPDLEEIPAEMASKIAGLPVEAYRKEKGAASA